MTSITDTACGVCGRPITFSNGLWRHVEWWQRSVDHTATPFVSVASGHASPAPVDIARSGPVAVHRRLLAWVLAGIGTLAFLVFSVVSVLAAWSAWTGADRPALGHETLADSHAEAVTLFDARADDLARICGPAADRSPLGVTVDLGAAEAPCEARLNQVVADTGLAVEHWTAFTGSGVVRGPFRARLVFAGSGGAEPALELSRQP